MSKFNFTKTILKNLFSKPVTSMYPTKKKVFFDKTRGHVVIEVNSCIFCGICSKKCPSNSIAVNKTDKQWEINRLRCIQCNACVENCPKKCLNMKNEYTDPSLGPVIDNYHA